MVHQQLNGPCVAYAQPLDGRSEDIKAIWKAEEVRRSIFARNGRPAQERSIRFHTAKSQDEE